MKWVNSFYFLFDILFTQETMHMVRYTCELFVFGSFPPFFPEKHEVMESTKREFYPCQHESTWPLERLVEQLFSMSGHNLSQPREEHPSTLVIEDWTRSWEMELLCRWYNMYLHWYMRHNVIHEAYWFKHDFICILNTVYVCI